MTKLDTRVDIRVITEVYQTDEDIQEKSGNVSGFRFYTQRKVPSFFGLSTRWEDVPSGVEQIAYGDWGKAKRFDRFSDAIEHATRVLQKELDDKISHIRIKYRQEINPPVIHTIELKMRG